MAIRFSAVSNYPALHLKDSTVSNEAPGDAQIAAKLAGTSRWLYEMTTGQPVSDNEPIAIPPNPQGTFGHDHSGPPYGSALRHPMFTATWPASSGDIVSPVSSFTPSAQATRLEFNIYNRPHPQHSTGPYTRGHLFLLINHATNAKLEISARVPLWDTVKSTDLDSVSTTGADTVDVDAEGTTTDFWLDFVPGWNRVELWLKNGQGTDPTIQCLSICQITKRSH